MRFAASFITLGILLPPLLGRADDKPKLEFACSVAISKGDDLWECVDLTVPEGNVDAIDKARQICKAMAENLNGEEGAKHTPRLSGTTSSIDRCDLSEYLTRCIYPKDRAATAIMTNHAYVMPHALDVKQECDKNKGKWSENPAYKSYLHPPKISAEQLHQEWRTNQAKAMQERGKKTMALYGKLYQVKVDQDDEVSVILNVAGFQRLVMVMGISSTRAAEFKPNTTITFDRCLLTGRTQLWDNPIVTCE